MTSCAEILLELSQSEASHTCCTMTELTADEISDLISERDHLKEENVTLKSDKAALSAEVAVLRKAVLTPESLVNDDAKVKYFTGLPSYILKAVSLSLH